MRGLADRSEKSLAGQGVVDEVGDFIFKRLSTQSSIDQQILVTATDVPDVTTEKGMNMRLPEQGEVIRERSSRVPLFC